MTAAGDGTAAGHAGGHGQGAHAGGHAVHAGGHGHGEPAAGASGLVPLEVYRTEILGRVTPLEDIEVALLEAHGCVLAEDVAAGDDIPRFDNSAMDGYAVSAAAVSAGEALQVVGESAAGSPSPEAAGPGRAVRIMTGAPLPEGADAVVPVEQADERDGRVVLAVAPASGTHVRPAGEDVRAGAVVLARGRRLGPADLGMLASIGRGSVRVHPRPRVVVISTGDELVEPGSPLAPGQLYDSNSYTLAAMAREAGARAYRQAIVPDDRRALQEAFEGALSHADLLVTSGGVSAGRYDLVKEVLSHLGDVKFTRVAMRPGMPQAFGFVGRDPEHAIPCFGLPGNPVSAFVSFEVFVRPALRRLQGRSDLNRPRVTAVMSEPVETPVEKVTFVRVTLHQQAGTWQARPTGPQGSGLLHSVVEAHGLAEVPVGHPVVQAGQPVLVHLLVDTT